jgi:group I intron endonuclease
MIIYKTINLINNKIYIGQDTNNNPNYIGSGNLLKKSIKKHGKENFIKEVLCICTTQDELNEKERFYINKHNSIDKNIGYNISHGGTNGTMLNRQHSDETKIKMKKAAIGKKKSDIHCKNIGLSKKGRVISDEERKRRSDFSPLKGQKKGPLSIKVKEKISNSKTGTKLSEETKRKMSESQKGEKNGFYGKKHSENFMKTKRKVIIQLNKNDEPIKEWKSISDASKELNVFNSNICNVLKGKYKTTGGFKFIYKNE